MSAGPRDSMSMARRETKWRIRSTCWAGHLGLTQWYPTSPSRCFGGDPQDGHASGGAMALSLAPLRASSTTPRIFGIISPPLMSVTVSPSFSPRRSIWS